ncbi:hypothetical protein GPECTOR_46g211 [Gonium pectorale]|uniref:MIB/HERC2 domain-containing protein n=1 Tax=Gonium pectorale TaxID=33097 RepID=A0A150G8H1_GONPE|nr:hypothetical protein GPECTOR_46g211 [Gonium pectorale]|eukprot:KXZ46142.1 hypothetical protein GPECTOR_46g211 [Gonium pectorale]
MQARTVVLRPGPPLTAATAVVGALVVRGPGWAHGDADGGPGGSGVVLGCTEEVFEDSVAVRWRATGLETYHRLAEEPGGEGAVGLRSIRDGEAELLLLQDEVSLRGDEVGGEGGHGYGSAEWNL